MNSPTVLKVHIRNWAGHYLIKDCETLQFTRDSREAHIFDYHADNVTVRIKNARNDQGVILMATPTDPELAHERCDVCGRVMVPITAHFDGSHVLCEACMVIQNSQGG